MKKIKSGSMKLRRPPKYAMHRSSKAVGGSILRGGKTNKAIPCYSGLKIGYHFFFFSFLNVIFK